MSADRARLAAIVGRTPVRLSPLTGGCIAEVARADFATGPSLVVKSAADGGLAVEADMLRYLATHSPLPVPEVVYGDDRLLVLQCLDTSGTLDDRAQRQAADAVAALHDVRGPCFGFDWDTVIGALPQPNPSGSAWLPFFRDHRLVYMAQEAATAGRLPPALATRVERLAARVDRYLDEPPYPSLIHGDLWGGNVLVGADGLSGFVDPALYWADPEIELAFSTLFGTFGTAFFDRYVEHRPFDRIGFFEVRRDLYNLYPLLVHVRLFGGSYVGNVERTLQRFGV